MVPIPTFPEESIFKFVFAKVSELPNDRVFDWTIMFIVPLVSPT